MKIPCLKRLLVSAFLFVAVARAQNEDDTYGPQPTGAPKARAQYKANLEAYKDNPDVLVLPGLVADREARTVDVLAESTGLNAEETVEFLLVDQGSSHGYEALLWSFAKPSDVHRALMFIGLEPGAPVNPAMLRFWAVGDRVMLTVRVDDEELFPIEELVLDTQTGETLPEEGFVFAGSMQVRTGTNGEEQAYAADIYDPRSVAAIFNDPTAVLDVPRQVSQGESYGQQVVNPQAMLNGGQLVTVVMTPGETGGAQDVRRIRFAIDPGAASTGMVCRLTQENGTSMGESLDLKGAVEALAALRQKQETVPFLDVTFSERLPVGQVAHAARMMAVIEMLGMVRISPPAEGQLYYRAFVPEESWREPEGRPSQPWELHLSHDGDRVTGEMVWYDGSDSEIGAAPTFTRRVVPVADPAAVRAALDADARERQEAGRSPLPSVLLVFAGSDFTYGEVLDFVRPALSTHGTAYIFLPRPGAAADGPDPGVATHTEEPEGADLERDGGNVEGDE